MFSSAFEAELADAIPLVMTSIGGTRIMGRQISETLFCYLVYSLLIFTFSICLPRKQEWTSIATYYNRPR